MSTILADAALFGSTIYTRDGHRLAVRAVQPGDEEALFALFATLSADELRFRFLSPIRSVSAKQVEDLVDVDHASREHLLAFGDDDRLVASAIVARDPLGNAAEVAIAVAGNRHGEGIGTALLREVMAWARTQGIARLYTVETREHREAIMVERELGFTSRPLEGDASLVILEAAL